MTAHCTRSEVCVAEVVLAAALTTCPVLCSLKSDRYGRTLTVSHAVTLNNLNGVSPIVLRL